MTKTFCDRCGKEIKEEYGWITHKILCGRIKLLPSNKHIVWSDQDDKYICPECENSYIHWFMNPDADACNSCNRQAGCKDETDLSTRKCSMKNLR